MNFNFSAWSIRHPVPPILLFIILTIVGIVSFRNLAIEQFPNIDVPIIAVTVAEQGATPSELESQVTKIVEDAVAGVSGVKHITSTMSDGKSTTAVEYRLEVPTQKALQDPKTLSPASVPHFRLALMIPSSPVLMLKIKRSALTPLKRPA